MRRARSIGAARGVALLARTAAPTALTLAALAALTPTGVLARDKVDKNDRPAQKNAAPRLDDGLGPRDMYFEADSLVDDRDSKVVTAEGKVQARYGGRTLFADRVVYNTVNGVVHAIGNVTILDADGTAEHSRDVELDDRFRTAIAYGFSAKLAGNVTLASSAMVRRSETITQLNGAVYTPCNICKADGVTPKRPTWSIQATRIVQDHEHHVIYYRHMVIRVLDVPVFYAPVFWHPDPTAPRRSGFLTPKIEYSRRRGLFYEQPYYLAISPSADLTIAPEVSTRLNPILNLRYRERFYSGQLDVRAGYTYEQLFDSRIKYGDETSRSYILGKGKWELTADWTVGFGAERVTDPTFFHRYGVAGVFSDRGPFPTDTDRLISQAYAQRQDTQSFFSVAALSFESLRSTVVNQKLVSYDTGQAFPVAAPLVEGRFDPSQPILGGRFRFTGSAVSLDRNNRVLAITDDTGLLLTGPEPYPATALPAGSPALIYRNSSRVSGEADWRRAFTLPIGLRIAPFVNARGDLFTTTDGTLSDGFGRLAASDERVARGNATVGADVSFPFIKPIKDGSIILEPMVQLAASPRLKQDLNIPNEESVAFQFDETNLFELDREPGYSLEESGQRANVGGRATVDFGKGRSASFLVGRTFRTAPDAAFSPISGIRGTSSDYVVAATLSPGYGVSFFSRSQLDAASLNVRRQEAGLNYSTPRFQAGVRYNYEQNGLVQVQCTRGVCPANAGASVIGEVENLTLSGNAMITKHYGALVNATRDLRALVTNAAGVQEHKALFPIAQVGVYYVDECIRVDVLYTHDETYVATIGPSNAVGIRLTLTTLGGNVSPGARSQPSR